MGRRRRRGKLVIILTIIGLLPSSTAPLPGLDQPPKTKHPGSMPGKIGFVISRCSSLHLTA